MALLFGAALMTGCAETEGVLSDAEWRQICVHAEDPRHRVRGCTALIDGGALEAEELMSALTVRAGAYLNYYRVVPQQYGQALDRAIADSDRALRLDPSRIWAWIHRCTAHKRSHRLDLAISDCT